MRKAQRRGLALLALVVFKPFITLNFLKFLSLDGPPNTNFFNPLGSADPTSRTYALRPVKDKR